MVSGTRRGSLAGVPPCAARVLSAAGPGHGNASGSSQRLTVPARFAGTGPLPGVARDDISVEMAGQELIISGEFTDTAEEGRALRRGRRSGRLEYRALLPGHADPDQATAALADGVLTVTAPKTQTHKPRRIQVTVG
jgi:Hsp20/alpha crystallin family protein